MAALSRQDKLDLRLTDSEDVAPYVGPLFRDPFSDDDDDDDEGNYHDKADMQRMNKSQCFRRHYGITSVVGFTSCVMGYIRMALCLRTSLIVSQYLGDPPDHER